MKRILYSFAYVLFLFSIIPVTAVHAETHITQDTQFQFQTIWTKEGSPYVLDDDITIPSGHTLQIGPGVIITTSSSSPGSLFVLGTLLAAGTADQPIAINNLTGFWISFSTSTISNAVINVPTGLNILKSNIVISSSTITDADKGIDVQGSTMVITGSVLSGNNYGLYSEFMPPPIPLAFNFWGINVAHAQVAGDSPLQNHISISSSSIIDNRQFGVFNSIANIVHAENNWWGTSGGPAAFVSGAVDYTPWITKDPYIHGTALVCCSNVLFLPGIEASRLYKDQKSFIGSSTNQLWEPNRNDDVRDLFMTPTGQSINSGIYTKDIIDTALGVDPVYKGFIAMMNGVVADKIINSWNAYPYDWRFDVSNIVSQKLIGQIQSLASTSKTGKVTIVAHSNGGLVAKLLAKNLADMGESGLLDKVILVAVPQLGTPQAVAGLLHGDGESILDGLVTSQSVARQLGDNMPGGYGLLPSRSYFSKSILPVISFSSSTFSDFHFTGELQMVSGYDALKSFLVGMADKRTEPPLDDTSLPTLLHSAMIDSAQKIHNIIDAFSFASTTKTILLAGWGRATLTGISYYEKTSCSDDALLTFLGRLPSCVKSLEHSASTTLFGDDTVVMESADVAASSSNSSNYYFDLGSESKGKIMPDGHSSILSTNSGVAFIKEEVTASSALPIQAESLPLYISNTPPTMADVHQDDLVVSIHSPVELNMYDSQGRHTGPIPNPDPTSDLGRYETGIPGSDYVPNDGDTYIRVPYGTDYKVTFSGIGMGSFEVDTEHDVNGRIASTTMFADMPVTPLLKAELILATTTRSSPASTTQMMLFDFDGNGTVDATSTPHDAYDPVLDMESYQAIISTLNLAPLKEKIMHDKIAMIIDCFRKKKPIKEVGNPNIQAINAAKKAVADLQNQHWIFKNLDPVRKQKLEAIFQAFLDNVDVQ